MLKAWFFDRNGGVVRINTTFVFLDDIDIDPSIKYNRLKLKGDLGIFE